MSACTRCRVSFLARLSLSLGRGRLVRFITLAAVIRPSASFVSAHLHSLLSVHSASDLGETYAWSFSARRNKLSTMLPTFSITPSPDVYVFCRGDIAHHPPDEPTATAFPSLSSHERHTSKRTSSSALSYTMSCPLPWSRMPWNLWSKIICDSLSHAKEYEDDNDTITRFVSTRLTPSQLYRTSHSPMQQTTTRT